MDRRKLNTHKKFLEKLKKEEEKEKARQRLAELIHPNSAYQFISRKLTLSGLHAKLTIYDEPVVRGFKRSEEAIEKGVESRQETQAIRQQMLDDFKHFGELYASATKDNDEALAALEKLKNKYADVISVREDNMKRKINALKAKIQANFDLWTHFITLSFRNNETDLKRAKKRLEKFIEKVRERIDPDFAYVYVVEFQKRGAIHFHMVCSIWNGEIFPKEKFNELCELWRGKKKEKENDSDGINVKGIKYKYNRDVGKKVKTATAEKLEQLSTNEKVQMIWSVGSYLTSYLKKDAGNVLLFGSQIYGASAGLKEQIEITDDKKIEQILLGLGTAQLKEKTYKIPVAKFDQNGQKIETDSFITMHYYNMLITKDDDK